MPGTAHMPLPYVDEHTAVIGAGTAEVWNGLEQVVDRSFSGASCEWFARLVGAEDRAPGGPRPLTEGSAIVGFRVAAVEPGRELVLRGEHRFSEYALTFRLDVLGPQRTRLRAETRAAFPGVAGRSYGALVVGTRGHVLLVRRLLGAVRRRAESQPAHKA